MQVNFIGLGSNQEEIIKQLREDYTRTVKEKESIIDFYMPPHDQQGFASLLACFPFFISKKVAEIKMDEQLKHLYGQNILFKASMKYIINHIPKSLFNLKSREIDLESDMEYIRANN